MKGKTLFLVDGSAVFYRAYFAFIKNPLINSRGENTSASYGFINSILKIIKEEKPDYIAIVFDTKAPTFRHKMYSEYKSTRAKMPEELVLQLPRIKQATDVLSLPALELEGYEADDIIGTLARKGEKQGMEVWIVSGDKDMFQLVSDRIKIYNTQKGSLPPIKLDSEGVEKKFGVPPDKVIDVLTLMGDSSDNVPGVPGIGPKTAIALLDQFGNLDNVLSSVDKIKSKSTRNKIVSNLEKVELSRKLVTIDTSVPIDFSFKEIRRAEIDFKKAKDFFMEMEFFRLFDELAKQTDKLDLQLDLNSDSKDIYPKTKYICIDSISELERLIKELSSKKEIAIDTETTSLNTQIAELVGVSLCAEAGKAYYIPIGHDDKKRNIPRRDALKLLSKFLKNKDIKKIGQNIKYDLEVLRRAGLDIEPISFDTMLASYLINPSGRHGLDALVLEHFDYRMQPISDLIGVGKKQKVFSTVDVDKAVFYAAEDADYTYRLWEILAPKIDKLNMRKLYYNIEMPLINVLAAMETEGVRVDCEYLAAMSKELQTQLDKLTTDIFTEAGEEFNINSTQQLSRILFEVLRLPTKGKTAKKTGYSTDVRVLEELAAIHDLPGLMIEYRQLTKLKSTYIDAIPKLVNNKTGRVHTSFNQTIATTGRLSSTDPNLQNIPIRTELGGRIRRAFIPRDDNYRLLVADYSQVELRVDIEAITPEMRRAAKTANFAIIYGVSAFGLSQQTGLDVAEAKEFIETYLARYPGIKKYIDSTIEAARKDGYVTTLFNRVRYLPEIKSKNYQVRQFAERIAINTPIQGTAADMIKVAMINIHDKIKDKKSKMLLQVHDELVFDAHNNEIDELKDIVKQGMEKAVKLKVPLVVDVGLGDNWLDAK